MEKQANEDATVQVYLFICHTFQCAENVEFEGQPEGVDMYVHNTKCDAAAA